MRSARTTNVWSRGCRIAVLAAVGVLPMAASAEQIDGKGLAVESGDTLLLTTDEGILTVRLADIAAPQGSAYFAPSARTLLSNMVLDANVRVTVTGRAGANRVFGRAYVGELDVNLELVKRGAAWMCIEYTTTTDYLPFQNEAIRRRWGSWPHTTDLDAWVACRARPPAAVHEARRSTGD